MNIQDFDPKTQQWLAQFNAAMADADLRRAFIDSPLESLKQLGGPIDAAQHEAVARGIQAASLEFEFRNRQEPAAARGQLTKQQANDFEKYFHLKVEWWGFVMRVDHAAIKELPKGLDAVGTLAKAALGVVTAAAKVGPLAVVVAMGLAYWAAIFTAYIVVLPELDKGKGVYLTVTWPQIGIAVASGGLIGFAALPVPTTVV